jgi:hypothetical protein
MVWSPSWFGAVHDVVAAVGAENPPAVGLDDHANAMVSPESGSCAVALAVSVSPGATLVDENTRASSTGTAFLKGAESVTCWAVMVTVVTPSFRIVIPEALPAYVATFASSVALTVKT